MTSVYLDYNASTPLEPAVLQEITDALTTGWANPSSSYAPAQKARKILTLARGRVASAVGGKASDIVFTSGGTESNQLVFHTALRYFRDTLAEDISSDLVLPHFIITEIEHDSVKKPLLHYQEQGEAEVTFVSVRPETCCVHPDDVIAAIRGNTCMISVMMANNETGVIQPVSEIIRRVRAHRRLPSETSRILIHSDAAQTLGKISVDVQELNVDYLTIVGHKFYGPRIGALYVRGLYEGISPLFPLFHGGMQERGLRPGTENTGMIAGLGKAAALVTENEAKDTAHLSEIRDYLETRLQEEFPGKVHFNGKCSGSSRLPNTCNVSIIEGSLEGYYILSRCRVLQASIGAACHAQNSPSPILLNCGISTMIASAALRLSVGRHTTKLDIDAVVDDIKQAITALTS